MKRLSARLVEQGGIGQAAAVGENAREAETGLGADSYVGVVRDGAEDRFVKVGVAAPDRVSPGYRDIASLGGDAVREIAFGVLFACIALTELVATWPSDPLRPTVTNLPVSKFGRLI